MPELPEVVVYIEALEGRVGGRTLEGVRVASPFLVRTAQPPLGTAVGRSVRGLHRLGKRIVFALEGDLFLVLHLMVAGRLQWRDRGAPIPRRVGLAAFDFPNGTLVVTEASSKKRAALHVVGGEAALAALDPGGVEVLETDLTTFAAALQRENHTLKRALTDPRLVSGIGNAYADEILHRARLSPLQLTGRLSEDDLARLFAATRETLVSWTDRLREETGAGFPEKVRSVRKGMAVHGQYGRPCPECGAPVQRIVYAENETNYCARCQTGGRLLADRALSRLLRADWPARLEELA